MNLKRRDIVMGLCVLVISLTDYANAWTGSVDLTEIGELDEFSTLHISGDASIRAIGDINGDGFDDIVTGIDTVFYIISGHANIGDVTDILIDDDYSSVKIILPNSVCKVSCGDYTGNGCQDIAFGSCFAPRDEEIQVGEVYLVYSNPDIMEATTINLCNPFDSTQYTHILGEVGNRYTGQCLQFLDINGDEFDDLVFNTTYGTLYLFYGSNISQATEIDLNEAPGTFDETRIYEYVHGQTLFGTALSSGDINGDGFEDLVVGDFVGDSNGYISGGRAYILYGHENFSDNPEINLNFSPGLNGVTYLLLGTNNSSYAGESTDCGDVNGDGYDDVVVGARHAHECNVGSNLWCGAAYVVYGNSLIQDATEMGLFDVGTDLYCGTPYAYVATQDVNGNGIDDILVSTHASISTYYGTILITGSSSLPGKRKYLSCSDKTSCIHGEKACSSKIRGDLNSDGTIEFEIRNYLISQNAQANQATKIRFSRQGNSTVTDFGPVLRCKIDYSSGETTSQDQVTLIRSLPSDTPTGFVKVLPIEWQIDTDRGEYLCDVVLRYNLDELGNADEESLVAYTISSATGGWIVAGTQQVIDSYRNEVIIEGLNDLSRFILVDKSSVSQEPPGLNYTGSEMFQYSNYWQLESTQVSEPLNETDFNYLNRKSDPRIDWTDIYLFLQEKRD